MEESFDLPRKDEGETTISMPLWRKLVEKDRDFLEFNRKVTFTQRGATKTLQDDIVESGPALIAMIGPPCTDESKSSCASDIATYLRCTHLNFDDIRACTHQAHQHLLLSDDPEAAAAARTHLGELSHRALLKFASTQLLLGHDVVVVDSPLSRPGTLHRLLDLADSHGVPLMVVEFTVPDKSARRKQLMAHHPKSKVSSSASSSKLEVRRLLEGRLDCEANCIPRLVIDTSQVPSDITHIILKFVLLYRQNLRSNCKSTASSSYELGREGEKLKRHFSHSHPLIFVPGRDSDKESPAAAVPNCRICLLPITGSSYNCPQCDFHAHESCIELPQCSSFPLHIHPLSLYIQSYASTEPKDFIYCIVCSGGNKGPLYRCWQCHDLNVDHKCTQLPPKLKHPCHERPLKLKTYDGFDSRSRFTCRACGHLGGDASYGCSACKLRLHVTCALELPLEVEYTCARFHPLVLAPPPQNDSDEYYCDVCEEERHRDYWIYYCHSCEFHAHLHCVNPEIWAYDMEESKNSRDNTTSKDGHESDDVDDDDADDNDTINLDLDLDDDGEE